MKNTRKINFYISEKDYKWLQKHMPGHTMSKFLRHILRKEMSEFSTGAWREVLHNYSKDL